MKKPKLKTKEYYDYMECRDYIKEKYKLDDRELWDWMCDSEMIHNGGSFTLFTDSFDYEEKNEEEEKAKEFSEKLFEEFGPDKAELEFEVSW